MSSQRIANLQTPSAGLFAIVDGTVVYPQLAITGGLLVQEGKGGDGVSTHHSIAIGGAFFIQLVTRQGVVLKEGSHLAVGITGSVLLIIPCSSYLSDCPLRMDVICM